LYYVDWSGQDYSSVFENVCYVIKGMLLCSYSYTRLRGLVGWFRHGLFRGFLLLESFSTVVSVGVDEDSVVIVSSSVFKDNLL
jgi:hypothetical protein